MSNYIFHIESRPGKINPSAWDCCFNQLNEYVCDQVLSRQTDSVFAGFRRLNTEGVDGKSELNFSEESRYWGILDGCIDNIRALTGSSQISQDYTTTQSILALYKAQGTTFLEKLQGRFSLVIIDRAAQLAVLYRSRLGQVPLYYHASLERLIAASEERAIAAHPDVSSKSNAVMLSSWFSLVSSKPAGHTAFTDIRELLPGECLVWNRGNTRQWRSPLQLG